MTDIQKARDVLAKWRADQRPMPWQVVDGVPLNSLLYGLGANTDLLDAIDLVLDDGSRYWAGNPVRQHAQRIAAAILAAGERMQQ